MIAGLLIDISGVLHVGDEPIIGSAEAVRRLRRAGYLLRFVTNTSRLCRAGVIERLERLQMPVAPEEVITAPLAGRKWLEARGLRPHLLIHPDLAADFRDMECGNPNAVFLGDAGEYFDYPALNRAFRLLMDGAPLVAVARNRYFQEADGLSLDMGAFVTALEYAAGVEAVIIGKPSAGFFESALADMDLEANQVLMVGDDAEADVLGAIAAGLQGALVRTGKYRPGDEERLENTTATVFRNLEELSKSLKKS